MITVRVFREIGNSPVSGKRVGLSSNSLMGGTLEARTNSNGDATFDVDGGKDFTVYVDGKIVHRGRIVGVQIVYIR